MAKPILNDELWEIIEPLLPKKKRRFRYPGRKPIPDREALTGILFVLKTGIAWEDLPLEMGCGSGMTCWRRLRDWQRAGAWDKIHKVLLSKLRQAEQIDDARPLYLVIFNLGRFRDLRRQEDTFGFSSAGGEEPPSTVDQFTEILREGPSLGIHTLVWCDTCNTLGRWLARQTIHDLEMRVAFQMSEGNSTMLIDSPDAGRLGAHRAILYDEGLGQMEKFRPYGPPDERWLTQVQEQLAARAE